MSKDEVDEISGTLETMLAMSRNQVDEYENDGIYDDFMPV